MAVRVWIYPVSASNPTGRYVDYKDADEYAVDPAHELDVADHGRLLATYAPGNWHHVEMVADKP